MSRLTLCALLVTSALLCGCAQRTARPPSADTLEAIRKLDRIVVLPPEVSVTQVAFTGENERLPAVERGLQALLESHAEGLLARRNYVVRRASDVPADRREGLEFDFDQLRSALGAAAAALAKTDEEKEEGGDAREQLPKLSVGASASKVATRLDADAILLVRYSGFQKTGGQVASDVTRNIVLGVFTGTIITSATEGGRVLMALIDGTTGDVLWMKASAWAKYPGSSGRRSRYAPTPLAAAGSTFVGLPTRAAPQRAIARPAPVAPAPIAAEAEPQPQASDEIQLWERVRASNSPADLQAYLDKYPDGSFVPLAKMRLETLTARAQPAPKPVPVSAPPPPAAVKHPTKQRNSE